MLVATRTSENKKSSCESEENLQVIRIQSRMPRRVPELSAEIAREGCGRDAACWRRDRSPFRQPPSKARNGGNKRQPGGVFFGYFLLAAQKKVTRPRGRDPDSNNCRASDSFIEWKECSDSNVGLHCIQPNLRTNNPTDRVDF